MEKYSIRRRDECAYNKTLELTKTDKIEDRSVHSFSQWKGISMTFLSCFIGLISECV